jgi:hypothetical protein
VLGDELVSSLAQPSGKEPDRRILPTIINSTFHLFVRRTRFWRAKLAEITTHIAIADCAVYALYGVE